MKTIEAQVEQDNEGRTVLMVPVRETIILPKGERKGDYTVCEGNKESMKVVYQGENVRKENAKEVPTLLIEDNPEKMLAYYKMMGVQLK